MIRRVLVTGGAGFLGQHVVKRLRGAGMAVRVLDRAEEPAGCATLGVEHVRADVLDSSRVASALQGVDAVVHAALAPPQAGTKELIRVNVEGTRALCAQALERNVHRFVLVSSTIVTKPSRTHPLLADAPLSRLDAYRSSRAEAESVVKESGYRGLSVAIVRPKTLVGPERVGAFAILFECVRRGVAVPVFGGGQNHYQLLDVRDLAEGVHRLLVSDATGLFFFGAREFGTVREDLESLIDHARTGAFLKFVPGWISRTGLRAVELAGLPPLSEWHVLSARGEDAVVDVSRAERELGWHPERSNARSLADAYDWYVGALRTRGEAPTTHPVPLSHRALWRLHRLIPGRR